MEKFDSPLGKKQVAIGQIAEELIRAADRIYRYRISVALGQDPPEGFERGNKDFQQSILDTVEPFLKDYQQTKNINANTSGEVISLLKKGRVTPNEAFALLKLIKEKITVEEAELSHDLKKSLLEQLEEEDDSEEDEDGD